MNMPPSLCGLLVWLNVCDHVRDNCYREGLQYGQTHAGKPSDVLCTACREAVVQGKSRQIYCGLARHMLAGEVIFYAQHSCEALWPKARLCGPRQGFVAQSKASILVRLCGPRQDKARQGKARQGKARQILVRPGHACTCASGTSGTHFRHSLQALTCGTSGTHFRHSLQALTCGTSGTHLWQ